MAEIPIAMQWNGRPKDQVFNPNEYLYRRVPLELWEDGNDAIEIDAIELPDISTIRGKYGHPEWTRLEKEDYADWGVIGFSVQDIPSPLLHLGVFSWSFKPSHAPLKNNYPHSEVRAYENGMHINAKKRIDYDLHLRWREMLLRKIVKFIKPYEQVETRMEVPCLFQPQKQIDFLS